MASQNGGNGNIALPVVHPQHIEEPKVGLVPQDPSQAPMPLFSDQRIFVNAP